LFRTINKEKPFMYVADDQRPKKVALSGPLTVLRSHGYRCLIPLTMLLFVGLLFMPAVAQAQGTIVVDTTGDDPDVIDTGCSLREAIASANTDSDVDSCTRTGTAPYTINVPAGVYLLALLGAGEDNNETGDLDIRTSLVISGAGVNETFIQAGSAAPLAIDRVLQITGTVDVTIQGVTVRYGNTAGADENGGGIAITGGATVQVNDSAITANSSQGDEPGEGGGGLFNEVGGTLTSLATPRPVAWAMAVAFSTPAR
jgi:CSLREA domain-containing protein